MKIYKKSVGAGTLVTILIAIIIGIVLFTFGGALASMIRGGGDIESCRTSVLAGSFKVLGKSLTNLDCPRQRITVNADDVKKNGKIDDDMIKRAVAEQMRLCWYKMNEGKSAVFNQNLVFGVNTACIICSSIGFDDELKDKLKGKTETDFVKYLKETNVPDNSMKYYDYFYTPLSKREDIPFLFKTTQAGSMSIIIDKEGSFNVDDTYFIVYIGYSPTAWVNNDAFFNDLRTLIGLEKSKYYLANMAVLPAGELASLKCEYIYN